MQYNGHSQSILKFLYVRLRKNAGHCWRSKDEFKIKDVLLVALKNGQKEFDQPLNFAFILSKLTLDAV